MQYRISNVSFGQKMDEMGRMILFEWALAQENQICPFAVFSPYYLGLFVG